MKRNPNLRITMSESELEDFASILFKGHKVRRYRPVEKSTKSKRIHKKKKKKQEKSSAVVAFGVPILALLVGFKWWSSRNV